MISATSVGDISSWTSHSLGRSAIGTGEQPVGDPPRETRRPACIVGGNALAPMLQSIASPDRRDTPPPPPYRRARPPAPLLCPACGPVLGQGRDLAPVIGPRRVHQQELIDACGLAWHRALPRLVLFEPPATVTQLSSHRLLSQLQMRLRIEGSDKSTLPADTSTKLDAASTALQSQPTTAGRIEQLSHQHHEDHSPDGQQRVADRVGTV